MATKQNFKATFFYLTNGLGAHKGPTRRQTHRRHYRYISFRLEIWELVWSSCGNSDLGSSRDQLEFLVEILEFLGCSFEVFWAPEDSSVSSLVFLRSEERSKYRYLLQML